VGFTDVLAEAVVIATALQIDGSESAVSAIDKDPTTHAFIFHSFIIVLPFPTRE
jgi:hypothetical protein